jgi:hypothetical protein
VTAREIGRVTIAEALELTALVARKQPDRYGRFCRTLALRLSRGARAGHARRCRGARLEPAISRYPEGPRLGACDPEEGRTGADLDADGLDPAAEAASLQGRGNGGRS